MCQTYAYAETYVKIAYAESYVKIAKPYKNQINFFAYAESYVKILVLVRILDEFQKGDRDFGPAGDTDHGTLCVSSGPPLLTPMRTLRSKLLLGKNIFYPKIMFIHFWKRETFFPKDGTLLNAHMLFQLKT